MSIINCPKCGKENDSNSKFCNECGYKFESKKENSGYYHGGAENINNKSNANPNLSSIGNTAKSLFGKAKSFYHDNLEDTVNGATIIAKQKISDVSNQIQERAQSINTNSEKTHLHVPAHIVENKLERMITFAQVVANQQKYNP